MEMHHPSEAFMYSQSTLLAQPTPKGIEHCYLNNSSKTNESECTEKKNSIKDNFDFDYLKFNNLSLCINSLAAATNSQCLI